jgi:hypothetical protein
MAEDTSIIQSIINDLKVRMLYQSTLDRLLFRVRVLAVSSITDFLYIY